MLPKVCILDKYNLEFGQKQSTIWENTIYNLDKYNLQFGQKQSTIWANTIYN